MSGPGNQEDEAPSGLESGPVLRWGSHVGHLFEGADELHDVLVPYRPEMLRAADMIDVIDHHDLVLRRRSDRTMATLSAGQSPAQADLPVDRQQRTFDLAMSASQMGTWRYTLADNVCTYDENAQRLYGLTEARFLHDQQGVNDKFHPDDLELMWSRVARALDPEGGGHYDVEYRVKQLDGSWRWLSAWGTVEFEGLGPQRKAVAISGASRDLSALKQAEELQQLLVDELDHRVKNTLATVQAIVAYTLHRSVDLKSAREVLSERLMSLARAHELLTARNWTGADLRDLVQRAMEPFPAVQLDISGPCVEVSPNHTLALSLGLHQAATNAAKYGALSAPAGQVELRWSVASGRLNLSWRERGGPRVTLPTRRGFGSRLLEDLLARGFGSRTKLEYAPEGLRCEFTVAV